MRAASMLSVALPFFLAIVPQSISVLPQQFRVGSVFLEEDEGVQSGFRRSIESLPTRGFLNGTTIDFDIQYAQSNDYFHLYTRACLELNYGIVSLFGPSDRYLDQILDSVSTTIGVPYISTAPRYDNHERKNIIVLHPTQDQMITLIKDLVRELRWKDAAIIHDGVNGIIQPYLLAETLQFLGPVSVHSVSVDLRATLVQLRLRGARNIIIDTSSSKMEIVTQAALDTGMMTNDYTYIFTMLDMKYGNWTRLAYSQALVFGFNLIDERKFQEFQDRLASSSMSAPALLEDTVKVALILDAVELMARGLEAFDAAGTELTPPPPSLCNDEKKWEMGEEMVDAFSSVSFDGVTGPISISSGVRMKLFIELLKLNYDYGEPRPVLVSVGNWTQGIDFNYEGLLLTDKSQLTNDQPAVNKTLVITTIESKPCYTKLESGVERGYCVELVEELAKIVGFNYHIKVVGDGRYGKQDAITGFWNGMIGEVVKGEADLALADLTITTARAAVVDFSVPFMQTSIGILYKNTDGNLGDMGALLSPFNCWVWLSILVAFVLTALALRLVSWVSPTQKQEIIIATADNGTVVTEGLTMANSLWILASSMVLRGTDVKIKAMSSRLIATVWWFFALVVLILYASLVSHWFQPQTVLHTNSIHSMLHHPRFEFTVVQGTSTSLWLQHARNQEMQQIWWRIQSSEDPKCFQETLEQGVAEVSKSLGTLGLISETSLLQQALRDDCSLGLLPGLETRAYAVAVQKGTPLRDQISQGILTLAEAGTLKQLEEKWWPKPACSNDPGKPRLTFVHFIGLLTFLGAGIIVAIFVACGECLIHRRNSRRGFFRTHTEAGNGKIAMNDTESED